MKIFFLVKEKISSALFNFGARSLALRLGIVAWFLSLPGIASADTSSLEALIEDITRIVGVSIISLLGAVVFIRFILNIIQLFSSAGNASAQKEVKSKLIWSMVLLLAYFGALGIINLLASWVGFGLGGIINVPGVGIGVGTDG